MIFRVYCFRFSKISILLNMIVFKGLHLTGAIISGKSEAEMAHAPPS